MTLTNREEKLTKDFHESLQVVENISCKVLEKYRVSLWRDMTSLSIDDPRKKKLVKRLNKIRLIIELKKSGAI